MVDLYGKLLFILTVGRVLARPVRRVVVESSIKICQGNQSF